MDFPPCDVCGAPKARLNYNGISCTPCKSFFIRAVEVLPPYECEGFEQCSVIASDPKYCMGCRYKKCLQVGMNPFLVGRMPRPENVVAKISYKQDLIQRHVVPILSLGYHFVAQATCNMGPTRFARYFLSVDTISMNHNIYDPKFSYFNLNVSLGDVFMNSKLCYSNEDSNVSMKTEADAIPYIIAHGYCKFLASFANFASAVPELRFLSTPDKMRLIQNNHFEVAILRTLFYHHCDPPTVRSEKEAQMVQEVAAISKGHTMMLKHFLKFYNNHVRDIFTELNLSLEEMILLRLIAIFLPYAGNDVIRSARGKYTNIFIEYQNEVYSYMGSEEKLRRLRKVLKFLIKLKEYANEINQLWALQILNNVDNLTGTLSYDLHIRHFKD